MQAKKLEATGALEARVLEVLVGAPGGGHMHRAEVVEALGLSASHQEVALALGNLVNARSVERIGSTFRIRGRGAIRAVAEGNTPAADHLPDAAERITMAVELGSLPHKYIVAILEAGAHGESPEDVLQQLVWASIRRLVDEGWIDRMEVTSG